MNPAKQPPEGCAVIGAALALLIAATALAACATNVPAPVAPVPLACADQAAAVRQVADWRAADDSLPSLRYIEASRRADLARCLAVHRVAT